MEEIRKSLREQNNLIQVTDHELLDYPFLIFAGGINNCQLVNTYQVNTKALVRLEEDADFNTYTLLAVKEYVIIKNKSNEGAEPKIPKIDYLHM